MTDQVPDGSFVMPPNILFMYGDADATVPSGPEREDYPDTCNDLMVWIKCVIL